MCTNALIMALAAALLLPVSASTTVGFNYGANAPNGSVYQQSDFQSMFTGAQALAGSNGMFASARLYTSIQPGSTADPTGAFAAAMATKTRLLLGLWASSGNAVITDEITAITTAMNTYGSSFTDLVDGISVGSEDLYRITATSNSFTPNSVGAQPAEIVSYITQVRAAFKGTALGSVPIGHVDTQGSWSNSSNSAVTQACDFIGTDIYPYFETADSNAIGSAPALFNTAWEATVSAAQGKQVWLTETGWPVSGATENLAVPSVANAAQYYQTVGCAQLFGKVNTYWFQYFDVGASPSFGVASSVGGAPVFDLACSSSASAAPTSSASAASTSSVSAAARRAIANDSVDIAAAVSVGASASAAVASAGGVVSAVSASLASAANSGLAAATPTASTYASSSTKTPYPTATKAASAGTVMTASWMAGVAALLAALVV